MARFASNSNHASWLTLARVTGRLVALGMATAMAACSSETPTASEQSSFELQPKKPWTSDHYPSTRLILERTDSGFKVVSAAPSYGGVTQPNVAEMLPDILEGRHALYEYAIRTGAGDVLARGYFTMSLKARATYSDPDDATRMHHEELDDPSRVVRVAVAHIPAAATIEFQNLVPSKEASFERWDRVSAGSVKVESTPAGLQQGSGQQ